MRAALVACRHSNAVDHLSALAIPPAGGSGGRLRYARRGGPCLPWTLGGMGAAGADLRRPHRLKASARSGRAGAAAWRLWPTTEPGALSTL